MNKSEFINKLSEELDAPKNKTSDILDAIFKTIAKSMKENDELRFVGFGTFKAKNMPANRIKTPRGIMADVPAQRRVSFSVGSDFKAKVNEK
jgi:nucleoid DNA-binding protein